MAERVEYVVAFGINTLAVWLQNDWEKESQTAHL
jgi:hypothetical protein